MRRKTLVDLTEPELRTLMRACARGVHAELRRRTVSPDGRYKFVILVFDDPKVAHYVSSCVRADVIKALREAANKLEANEDVVR